jgi:uncharacterized circularly permuted ATP-grasp superfamily protein/uncharacterized alpha-E superfamily protein
MSVTRVEGQRLPAFLGSYRPPPGVYDELFDAQRALRPQWGAFARLLEGLGGGELARRWGEARRLIQERGVTYNVHGDPQGRDRRWELDALPLVVPHADWTALADALAQRARLLDAVLADLYGPQRLVCEGLLPAELVFAQPGFLRPCHGLNVAGNRRLHLYAAHLARSPEGAWWVVADRTQVPIGLGYAVENRIVISRMLPQLFHHLQVERLAGFFLALREALSELAPGPRRQPHVALWSPGPASPSYFEDSYLARYLGFTLVEGEDLTVRDDRVFLKTLGGLVGIDVLLRRASDDDCDPLELAGASNRGVPGLLQALRRTNVAVANTPGSGLVEMPGLMAFLPAICRRLLGEELRLPSVRTWWCGDKESRAYVLANLERLVVGSALADRAAKPVHAASLDAQNRKSLAARINAAPERFVAQELIVRSTAPVWNGDTLEAGHIALRAFVAAAGDSYRVMPGALAHVSTSRENLGESMFVGHGSKDVWVLAAGPVAPVTLLEPPGTPIAIRRSGIDLPSRVADNLFWLGRQLERADATARLLRSIAARLVSESAPANLRESAVLYRALLGPGVEPAGGWGDSVADLERRVMDFLFDERLAGSLQSILAALARVATVVRDRLSLDSWRILKRIEDDFRPAYPLGVVSTADVLAILNQLILNLSAFSGVATENMTRGPGWQFLELGRRIERALGVSGLLRGTLFVPDDAQAALFESLLEIADSAMTYRGRYAENLQLAPLLDLLVTDETNPRSIIFQVAALVEHVARLPHPPSAGNGGDERRLVEGVLAELRRAEVRQLAEADEHGVRRALDTLLADTTARLCDLASAVSHKYLVHAGPAHRLAEIGRS